MSKYDILKLENQMCFPLYAISREVIKHNPRQSRWIATYINKSNVSNVGRRKNSI